MYRVGSCIPTSFKISYNTWCQFLPFHCIELNSQVCRNQLFRYICHSDAVKVFDNCFKVKSRIVPHRTHILRRHFASTSCLNTEDSTPLNEAAESDSSDKLNSKDDETWFMSYNPATLSENIYDTFQPYEKKFEISEHYKGDIDIEEITSKKKNRKRKKKSVPDEKLEEMKKTEKQKYFSRSLKSYIQVCGNADMSMRAHDCLLHYRYKNKRSKHKLNGINMEVYNALLTCWAVEGNLDKFLEVLSYINEDNLALNLNSYVAYLECLSKCKNHSWSEIDMHIEKISEALKAEGKSFSDIFHKCVFNRDQLLNIQKLLSSKFTFLPEVNPSMFHTPYSCKLLEKLNDRNYEPSCVSPYINTCISKADIDQLTAQQIQLETDYLIKVKSIIATGMVSKKTLRMRKCVEYCEEKFKKQLSFALDVRLPTCFNEMKGRNGMTLYPYLHVISKDLLVKVMLEEVRWIIESAEYFSPSMKILCQNLGARVMNLYFIWMRGENKVTDKVALLHSKYLEYVLTPELSNKYSPREYWDYLKAVHWQGPTVDIPDIRWPHHILYEVGQFLYDIILRSTLFDSSIFKRESKAKHHAFYTIHDRNVKAESDASKHKLSLQIRAHVKLCKLYRGAALPDIGFDVTMLPMLCPPRPWTRLDAGGLLMTSTPFIRMPFHAHQNENFHNVCSNEQLHPCFDSLNSLSLCPWIINKPVLDLIIDVFRNNGCEELDVPLNPSVHFQLPEVKSNMSPEEKKKVRRERAILKKKKVEASGLWFDCLYKLSIANEFRDKIFWFPHNIDFRGRVYPTPPHFNHLGSDMVRSILLFAEGRPLGENGLNWLKIHLINLTGLKKREPNEERLRFANEVMPDILDSADKPFSGRQWWRESDEPWQTLACCMEVARAVRSPDPTHYVSHFPVHQDGSCNGLQHYAALGRDDYGAREVNLFPMDCPQDVYSGVAALVEEERKKDAEKGSELACVLNGFIKRKVVKQTIMTFVYGVTEYGAKHQILKQLKDIPEFPSEWEQDAARYLMRLTFASIQKMFTATREIQKWFTDCAELITKVTGEPVEWVTPLGLPVIQPYHKKIKVRNLANITKVTVPIYADNATLHSYDSTYEKYQPPNVRKQKNAFAPNFIHSLDSSHMMLTSLFCRRSGCTFVSVHDCYWTHPANVKVMNEICREQFVSLHSEPILENLSDFFVKKYGTCRISEKSAKELEKLNSVLRKVPEKGTFNLNCVLDSIYFFS